MREQWSPEGVARLRDAMARYVADGDVVGLAWAMARRGEVEAGAAGTLDTDGSCAVDARTIFRISSMTKPVIAVAALVLVDDGVLALDEPVDRFLPELASPRVLVDPSGPLDATVRADRAVTVRDLLTFRLGHGMDFSFSYAQAGLARLAELGLGVGPPDPAGPPTPDEWMRRFATVPLERQPGTRWLYHVSADVLGVLVARAAGTDLESFLRARVFGPLGMRDTGFSVPAAELDRFGPVFGRDAEGARTVQDEAAGGWSRPPDFPGGGAGLVSTLTDYLAFGTMLANGGVHRVERVLAEASVRALRTNHLTDEQLVTSAPGAPEGTVGWGFGVSVQVVPDDGRSAGTYGWDGGFGSSWANDPETGVVGVLLTSEMWSSPEPPPVCRDFWSGVHTAVAR
jgi:CubicO group peptidase (beta-lactamase class C family)